MPEYHGSSYGEEAKRSAGVYNNDVLITSPNWINSILVIKYIKIILNKFFLNSKIYFYILNIFVNLDKILLSKILS